MAISRQEYKARREQLLKKIGNDNIAIIPSANEQIRSHDSHYYFRQDSYFYYLTGFKEPDAVALFIPGRADGEYLLFNRERNEAMERWDGPRAGQQGVIADYDVNQAFPIESFASVLSDYLKDKNKIFYSLGRYNDIDKIVLRSINHLKAQRRLGIESAVEIVDVNFLIDEMRVKKSPAEIELMRKASEISAKAHVRAMQACKPGCFEYQLEAELMYEFYREGCRAPAYLPIVASGENACVLHYVDNQKQINKDDLVLIDAGGEFDYYAADITRTFPASGKFSETQKAIYEIVLRAQLAGIECIKPGTYWTDIQKRILNEIVSGLVELKILKGSVQDLIDKKAYQDFYMHSSGHWLGLDVHDAGSYVQNDEPRQLEEGMVLTVEPGLYFSPSKNLDKRWWNIGVRIEDDVLVTKNGFEVLSKDAPKTVAEIEALFK